MCFGGIVLLGFVVDCGLRWQLCLFYYLMRIGGFCVLLLLCLVSGWLLITGDACILLFVFGLRVVVCFLRAVA